MVLNYLLDQLSTKNRDDIQATLNAHSVLIDFAEKENFFSLLTSTETMTRLVSICGA